MKNRILKRITVAVVTVFTLAVQFSCSDSDQDNRGGMVNPPVITSVVLASDPDLEPVTQAQGGTMVIIRGSGFNTLKNVYFNDFDTYFNPAMVTDTEIFVAIDMETPYEEDAPQTLKVVNKNGEFVYHFVVAPPAPIVKSFQPVNAVEGDQITIYGNYFINPTVSFDGAQATVVSNTLTEIVAVMPANAQYKYITVETISGTASWGTAVGTAIYDDNFYAPWTIEAWNNHVYVTDLANAFQGTTFFKKDIPGWDNIQGNWDWDDQISQYTGIKFAVRSDTPGKLVFIFNGSNWGDSNFAFDTTTEWTEVSFTWQQLNNADHVQNITFQEFTGETHTYYFDNITYTVD
ncbi:IPT/TIG domain-containing protein [Flavobacterium sp. NRK F10]|nr:IPT/TIG domain-containing protein [Flavobacterium sp. NRK F10]MCO6176046.1 IPT/TIG domain-containing protein [Flavobacterium sp. NRK F10]